MGKRIENFFVKVQDSYLLTVLRHGLSMMIPVILIGGISNALLNLPIDAYQNFLKTDNWNWIADMLSVIYSGTFGLFSVAIVITFSFSYAFERNEKPEDIAMYVVVAMAAFGTHLTIGSDQFDMASLGVTGSFSAMMITLLSCAALSKLSKSKFLTMREFTIGMEGICANAIHVFVPGLIIVLSVAGANQFLHYLTGYYSIHEILMHAFSDLFVTLGFGRSYIAGLIYTTFLHLMWAIGLHGSHILEGVALEQFSFIGEGEIFSKTFFDCFVVMGGCGTTICVLLLLLFFYRKDRLGNVAKIATPTVIFNTNEMLNFGIPIILNPVLVVPFVMTPIVAYTIAYLSMYFGLVPTVTHEMAWTTPTLISGYKTTGDIRGSILQLVIIVIGIAIYYPFIRMHVKADENYAKIQMKRLVHELQVCEENQTSPNFLNRTDSLGIICKVLLKDLRDAINKDEIFLLYQPQVDNTGKCIGAEALLRWIHPTYGFVYPPLIIDLAKKGDLLEPLERKIFENAASAISRTRERYDGKFKISVNITAKSLLWDLESCIDECVQKYNIPNDMLWIEITEQDMISKTDNVIDKLNRLKSIGHTLLIDDFGMGHTSLLYLQSNYFNVVKLDGSLVKNLLNQKTNQKIVASIVELGNNLDVQVIAEYVETEEQKQLLEKLGCYWYQGYLYSKPIALDEFIDYICNKNKS